MNKKIGIYHNDKFNTLMVMLNDEKFIANQIMVKDNIIQVSHENEVIGVNFLNISQMIKNLPTGWITHHQAANDFVSQQFKLLKLPEVSSAPQLTIAKIITAKPIPETHLNLCSVFDGQQELQIICGAKNVQQNSLVVLASIGTWMPNGLQIKPSKLKGFESFGMLCSAKELQLTNHQFGEGIIILESSWEKFLGQDFMKVRENNGTKK